jgi:tetratricopeptide (TPR) repeat protein
MKRVLVVVIGLLIAAPLWAAPTPELLELGKREYALGEREFNLGHYEKALEHFEAAYRLTAAPGLLYNIGYTYRQLYQRTRKLEYLEEAIDRYRAFQNSTRGMNDPKTNMNRERTEKELKLSLDEIGKEKAERARGEEALKVGEDFLAVGMITEALGQVDKFEKTPNNERPNLARAFMLRGGIAAAERDAASAANWYERALTLDRSVALSPKATQTQQKAFAVAKERVGSQPVLSVAHQPPGQLRPPPAPVELTFTVTGDPDYLVHGTRVYYRLSGGGAYSALPVATSNKVVLPRAFVASLQTGMKIEYYAEAVDTNGAILEHLGTPALPFTAQVGKPAGVSVGRRWWFWTATVAVIAAAAVGGGLGYFYTQPAPPTKVPINVGLVHW